MATKELIGHLEDLVQCPVCLGQLKEPRSLPCQHSFCTACLQGLLGTHRHIRCPCCKKEVPVVHGVRQLPVDFRANSLLEAVCKFQKVKEAGKVQQDEQEGASYASRLEYRDTDQDTRLCPVCEEVHTQFKYLSCGHCLCGSCVQFLLPVGGDTLHCPTCSYHTRILPPSSNDLQTPSLISQPEISFEDGLLTFHPNCGRGVVVSPDRLTAHRQNPGGYCDAIVLTSRHLMPDELFEVLLDRKVDIWAGSIKIGVTTHSPTASNLPSYLSQLGAGTWCMLGRNVLHNGPTTVKQYEQNLDDLQVGDRVGVQRRANGDLHFYINGVDLGVGAFNVPAAVYGFKELWGKAEQVTIVHRPDDSSGNEPLYQSLQLPFGGRLPSEAGTGSDTPPTGSSSTHQELHEDGPELSRLTFHPECRKNAVVLANQITAYIEDPWQNCDAILLTNQHLEPNKLFEVRLDKKVKRWVGTVKIGVTTHSPTESGLPQFHVKLASGVWCMSGRKVYHNSFNPIKEYEQNLDDLKVGERVGVQRTLDGDLHFYINGVDLGVAASDVPADVYGVVILCGKAGQVTITGHTATAGTHAREAI